MTDKVPVGSVPIASEPSGELLQPQPPTIIHPTSTNGDSSEHPSVSFQAPGHPLGQSASRSNLRDIESGKDSGVARKKSLVRPERERMDPSHRQWYYRNHAAQMDNNARSNVMYMPSSTGHLPQHGALPANAPTTSLAGPGGGVSGYGVPGAMAAGPAPVRNPQLRRGKSILGREDDKVESGIHFLRRGVSMRRTGRGNPDESRGEAAAPKPRAFDWIAPGPVGPWMVYSWLVTMCITSPCLTMIGIKTPEQQRAWREKMGLISIILMLMAIVGYITFGFTNTVCGVQNRYPLSDLWSRKTMNGMINIYGTAVSLDNFQHPNVTGTDKNEFVNLTSHPVVYVDKYNIGRANMNLLFPRTGGSCQGVLDPAPNLDPPRYFNCRVLEGNKLPYQHPAFEDDNACHQPQDLQLIMNKKVKDTKVMGDFYVRWDQLNASNMTDFMYWRGNVIDLSILKNFHPSVQAKLPPFYKELLGSAKSNWTGRDITAEGMRANQIRQLDCLAQIARVGSVDVDSYGCIASKVELVLSMIFIVGLVGIKFLMAVFFAWFLSWRMGNYDNESYAQRMKRMGAIEDWTHDIYRPAPAGFRPNVKKSLLPTTSRFTYVHPHKAQPKPSAMEKKIAAARWGAMGTPLGSPPSSPSLPGNRSTASLNALATMRTADSPWGPCPWPLTNIVPQPPASYQPFNFPLAHCMCLVTAYSESFEGLRTTLDSLATTNYPNSHKLLLVIADGIVKGADSDVSTPDICLSMMKDLIVPAEEVEGHSYVAIADGAKRHNMAKVYAGFYDYDNQTVERSKQQRVPMILVAKCGTVAEMDSAKPGNRGKRDSQVLLMAFLQKVLFDERMTLFEYEFFNSIWRVTGVTPEKYEIILMVDADTKVFPDSLTRMAATMVEDPEIMGLCGETKIANKTETWVTMIQVFEYYISHHQTKGFEACFGGVTCLPGCFSAYRIKSPKGPKGFYVPILANPDIVEHYSENVVDTLHKKNLLLLGEDRFLTTLMLKTFPKRKMMFLPSAVCKTVVPEKFKVLRSQRRRWINSTVHNLLELIQVRDLCGTFCFSMRFVVFMDLVGSLVLPAALAFTIYVAAQGIVTPIDNNGKDPAQKKPFPTMPLILLALILGLPGVLIVITSRRFMYVLWLIVYLISLPVWNMILPIYAFWHMDDFSWGATRVVQGEKKGDSHGDAEGTFDATEIVMKRWVEFERERRWRSGLTSRDMSDGGLGSSARYSSMSDDTNSSSERKGNGTSGTVLTPAEDRSVARARGDSVPLLELPAPLGADSSRTRPSAPGSVVPHATAMASPPPMSPPQSDASLAARQHPFGVRPPPTARPPAGMSSPPPTAPRPPGAVMSPPLRPTGPAMFPPVRPAAPANYTQLAGFSPPPRPAMPRQETPPQPTAGMPRSPWAATSSPPPAAAFGSPFQARPPSARPSAPETAVPPNVRRVSLTDDGPVAGADGVRRVVRGSRRQSTAPQLPPFDAAFGNPFDMK